MLAHYYGYNKRIETNKYWQGGGKPGISYIDGGNVKWYSHFRKQFGRSSKY